MEAGFLRTGVVAILWWCVVVVQGGFTFHKTIHNSDWYQVSIPRQGIYLVMLTVDPNMAAKSLRLAGYEGLIEAYGDHVISGLTVALPLHAGRRSLVDWSSSRRHEFEDVTALSVAHIADLGEGYFILVRMKRADQFSPNAFHGPRAYFPKPVLFNLFMDGGGHWMPQRYSSIAVPRSGIHWISARPDPELGKLASVNVLNNDRVLFTVWADNGQAISTSGAYYFERNSHVSMKIPRSQSLYAATMLTFVILPRNSRNTTGILDHIAWTAYVDDSPSRLSSYRRGRSLRFLERTAMTDYGSLYRRYSARIVIYVAGSYLIAIRLDPICSRNPACSLKGVLHLNGHPTWTVWAERGVPIGQAVALSLSTGDALFLKVENDRDVDSGTMMSVAFVSP